MMRAAAAAPLSFVALHVNSFRGGSRGARWKAGTISRHDSSNAAAQRDRPIGGKRMRRPEKAFSWTHFPSIFSPPTLTTRMASRVEFVVVFILIAAQLSNGFVASQCHSLSPTTPALSRSRALFSTTAESATSDVATAKTALLDVVNRGVGEGYYLRDPEYQQQIAAATAELETSTTTDVKYPADLSLLDGRWRLLYTSNLSGLGQLSPLTLKTVFQVVDVSTSTLRNVVYATLSPPFLGEVGRLVGGPIGEAAARARERLTSDVDFTLDHRFKVVSQTAPAQIEIVITGLRILRTEEPLGRTLSLPTLRPLASAAGPAGRFDTTFLDADVRVSRGGLGELRVFAREKGDDAGGSGSAGGVATAEVDDEPVVL